MKTVLEHNGFKAKVIEAERLKGDIEHELPPGIRELPVYSVSEFKKHPDNWIDGDDCFVIPVKPNKGLWFDWRDNSGLNTAILPTVKGCNPITGMKTEGYGLERYENKCPTHGTEFKHDNYCDDCGYKWPSQNYITTPNVAWWDGFRENDGSVRQFFFTEDMMRDIASHKIGKKNTVPAFGFAFYETKVEKSLTVTNTNLPFISHHVPYNNLNHGFGCNCSGCYYPIITFGAGTVKGNNLKDMSFTCFASSEPNEVTLDGIDIESIGEIESSPRVNYSGEINMVSPKGLKSKGPVVFRSLRKEPVKEVAVGAGAKIKQSLQPDTYKLDEWKDEPSSVMKIYFVFETELDHWKSFGMNDIEGKVNGMLDDLLVG